MTCVICFQIYVNYKEVSFVKIGMSKHAPTVSPYKINNLLGIIVALSMYFMLNKYISSEGIDVMFEHLLKSPLDKMKLISKRCKYK